jgi:TRAP-type uncharacterized transport system substrate-binding protein
LKGENTEEIVYALTKTFFENLPALKTRRDSLGGCPRIQLLKKADCSKSELESRSGEFLDN